MSNSKHTPGPWIWSIISRPFSFFGSIHDSNGFKIANLTQELTTDKADESEANLRLISVAPDLLRLLEQFMSFVDQQHDDQSIGPALKEAKSVIAKAQGE